MSMLSGYTKKDIEHYLMEVLGDDPIEHRPKKYLEALNGIGVQGIRKFISGLLENGIPNEIVENSYYHPNKFFKLGICRLSNKVKLRLHFWNKDHLEVQTPIHFHAWDFASLLITGSYTHDLFKVSDLEESLVKDIELYKLQEEQADPKLIKENYFGMYKIPKRDGSLGKFTPKWVKYVQAERISRKFEREGSSYFLGMEYPHQITIDLKEVGSMITLVLTSETDRENLFTFQPIRQKKIFDNPSPNVDEVNVRMELENILIEIEKTYGAINHG